MKIGDKIKFTFAKKEKEGVVYKLADKSVYLKVEFPKNKKKIVTRKRHELK